MPETTRTPVFSRYELIEELGEGAFGAVYKARHRVMKRLVALKVLPPALRKDAETRERFEREAEALARLNHPHVVQIHDADIEQSFPYLAMEFVEGRDLRKVLQERKRLSVDEVIQLGVEMAQALNHVHSQGIVHRDVKPSNIMIGPDGHAKLTDFGIAFAATLPRITQGVLGTPEYMSPEQVEGRAVNGRSDLYSLGAVLYECLAGAVPFRRQGEGLTEMYALLKRIQEEPVPTIRRADVPPWLADVLARCLAKEPGDRFPDGEALAKTLRVGLAAKPDDATIDAETTTAEAGSIVPQAEIIAPDVKMAIAEIAVAPRATPRIKDKRFVGALMILLLLTAVGYGAADGWFKAPPQALRDALRNPTAVKTLDLGYDQLTEIPESITQLTNLKMLILRNNQLTEIPESITQLTNLERLYLGDNQLTTVPESISQLTNLKTLNLHFNPIPQTERENIQRLLPYTNITF